MSTHNEVLWEIVETSDPACVSSWYIKIGPEMLLPFFPYKRQWSEDRQQSGLVLDHEKMAVAKLIAAAPDLLGVLKARVKNEEQRIFEDWLHDKTPSGDVEQVQDQWERSSEYLDFHDAWDVEISAIAKAEREV